METIIKIMWAVLPSLLVGVMLFLFQKKTNKRDKDFDDISELRAKESLLKLQLLFAIGELSYAIAMAYKRGFPNGEIEEGIEAFEDAKGEYNKFLNNTQQHIINKKN